MKSIDNNDNSQNTDMSLNPQVAKSSLFQEALWGFF